MGLRKQLINNLVFDSGACVSGFIDNNSNNNNNNSNIKIDLSKHIDNLSNGTIIIIIIIIIIVIIVLLLPV